MTLKVLKEMLELTEDDLVARFKGGYNDAKSRTEKAKGEIEKRDKDAKETKAKVDKQAVADQIAQYLENFFTKFPNFGGAGGSEDIIEKYPDRETREVAINAFQALSARIEKLRQGFNKSLVASGKLQPTNVQKLDQLAKMMMGASAPAPPQQLVRFVKHEANFFKRLVRIKDNMELNDGDFKQLLQLKLKQTAAERVPDAAKALNLLFGYMHSAFLAHARSIAEANVAADDKDRKARLDIT